MKKVFSKIFMLSVGALAFTACADEYNPGAVTKEDLLKENYAKHWEEVFGTPDPNQDWSMAQPVVATLSVGSNATAEIYSDVPVYATSKLLGLVNGKTSTFNIVKGTNQVFALVKENGKTIAQGYYNVIDGKINIDNSPVTRVTLDNVWNMLATRAASNVTLGVTRTIIDNAEATVKKHSYNSTYYTLAELKAWATEQAALGNRTVHNYAPFNADCVVPAKYDFTDAELNPAKAKKAEEDSYLFGGNLRTLAEWRIWAKDNLTTGNYAPFNDDCLVQAHYDFTDAALNTSKVTVATENGYYYNGTIKTLADWRTWAENNSLTKSNHAPFNDDCIVPAGYDFTDATINTEKVIPFDKEGIFCNLQNQYAQSGSGFNVYTLAEIKADVEKRENRWGSTWPLVNVPWDEVNNKFDVTNATVNPDAIVAHVGSFYNTEYPNQVFANETEMQEWTKNNNKQNSGPYLNCYFQEHLDFTNATINDSYKISSGNYIYNNTVYATLASLQAATETNGWKNDGPFTNCWFDTGLDFTKATIRTTGDNCATLVPQGSYVYDSTIYATLAELQTATETNNWYNNGPFTNCYFEAHLDFTDATVDLTAAPLVFPPTQSVTLQYINGVEKWAAEPWTLEVGRQLFGPGTFFMEGQKYYSYEDKLKLYGDTDVERKATLEQIEAGFSIVTNGEGSGEIEVPFIYGATQIQDQFGYIYYKADQEGTIDPLDQPHFVLMNDGRPDYNIYFDEWGTGNTSHSVGNMQLSGWTYENGNALTTGKTPDTEVYGTKYKLAFFGENYDQPATYSFPEGYKIIFFICPGAVENANADGTMSSYATNNFNYSLPELNKRIHHYYSNQGSLTWNTEVTGVSDMDRGAVKAVAWTTNGMTFMGFEDGGNDEDLNDIVFWVEGSFDPEQELVDVPIAIEEHANSWIFACEDLGGTFDYDFNDVVWEVTQEYVDKYAGDVKTGTEYGDVSIKLLAAGGTLPVQIYYDNVLLEVGGKSEVHALFGQTGSTLSPVNVTGTKVTKSAVVLKTWTPTDTENGINMSDVMAKFKLVVTSSNGTTYEVKPSTNSVNAPTNEPYKGADRTPQIILLPGEWEWPIETTPIQTAYDGFADWVQKADNTAWWNGWMNKKVSGKTVSR